MDDWSLRSDVKYATSSKSGSVCDSVDGLYLCGSGAHPGGGVSGVPGRNAANRILNDLRN